MVDDRPTPEEREAIFDQFKWSVQALSQPAEIQAALFPEFVCVADELAEDFAHWMRCALSYGRLEASERQRAAITALDRLLEYMTERSSEGHWSMDDLANDPLWKEVRHLARNVLDAFRWPPDIPPQRRSVYVPG